MYNIKIISQNDRLIGLSLYNILIQNFNFNEKWLISEYIIYYTFSNKPSTTIKAYI